MPMSAMIAFTTTYIADVRVRSTLYGFCYNLSSALILSNVFDVSTELANLNTIWGGLYVGIYICALNFLGYIGLVWCYRHPWVTKHDYSLLSVSPKDEDDEQTHLTEKKSYDAL